MREARPKILSLSHTLTIPLLYSGIKAIQEAQPYGEVVHIETYECVGHVQKRVGKAFIDLTKKTSYRETQGEKVDNNAAGHVNANTGYTLDKPLRPFLC